MRNNSYPNIKYNILEFVKENEPVKHYEVLNHIDNMDNLNTLQLINDMVDEDNLEEIVEVRKGNFTKRLIIK